MWNHSNRKVSYDTGPGQNYDYTTNFCNRQLNNGISNINCLPYSFPNHNVNIPTSCYQNNCIHENFGSEQIPNNSNYRQIPNNFGHEQIVRIGRKNSSEMNNDYSYKKVQRKSFSGDEHKINGVINIIEYTPNGDVETIIYDGDITRNIKTPKGFTRLRILNLASIRENDNDIQYLIIEYQRDSNNEMVYYDPETTEELNHPKVLKIIDNKNFDFWARTNHKGNYTMNLKFMNERKKVLFSYSFKLREKRSFRKRTERKTKKKEESQFSENNHDHNEMKEKTITNESENLEEIFKITENNISKDKINLFIVYFKNTNKDIKKQYLYQKSFYKKRTTKGTIYYELKEDNGKGKEKSDYTDDQNHNKRTYFEEKDNRKDPNRKRKR